MRHSTVGVHGCLLPGEPACGTSYTWAETRVQVQHCIMVSRCARGGTARRSGLQGIAEGAARYVFLAYDEFAATDSVASIEHMLFARQRPAWVSEHAGSYLLQALLASRLAAAWPHRSNTTFNRLTDNETHQIHQPRTAMQTISASLTRGPARGLRSDNAHICKRHK